MRFSDIYLFQSVSFIYLLINSLKSRFCDKEYSVCKILTLFQSFGWKMINMYNIKSYHPITKLESFADCIILQRSTLITGNFFIFF